MCSRGSLYDHEKVLKAGDYCCRAAGVPHSAGTRDGVLVLLVYNGGTRSFGLIR
jgi:hypothetical protein